MKNSFLKKDWLWLGLILLINLVPKIFYFCDLRLMIDGDEAIFGTMARSFLSEGQWPFFFLGQAYNFVFFEVLVAAFISYFFGFGVITLKISMFLFWLSGLIALFFFARKIFSSRYVAFLALAASSFIPLWFSWSTKARGGYLSAFLFSSVIMALVWSREKLKSPLFLGGLSLLTLGIFFTQPLWLLSTAPFLLNYFWPKQRGWSALKPLLIFLVNAGFFFLLIQGIFWVNGFYYQVPGKLGFERLFFNARHLLDYCLVAYSGNFFDSVPGPLNLWERLSGLVFLILFLLSVLYNILLIWARKISRASILLMVATLGYLAFLLFSQEKFFSYRYLLPFFIPGVFLIFLTVDRLPYLKIRKIIFVFLMVYTVFSALVCLRFVKHIFPFSADGYSEVERFRLLGNFLQQEGRDCVYALDWLLAWQLNYFVPGLKTRSPEIDPRKPSEVAAVDRLRVQKNSCALVGFWYHGPLYLKEYDWSKIVIISNRYVVYLQPQKEELLKMGFVLLDIATSTP